MIPVRIFSSSLRRSESSTLQHLVEPGEGVPAVALRRVERDIASAQRARLVLARARAATSPIEAETWSCAPSHEHGRRRGIAGFPRAISSASLSFVTAKSIANSSPPVRAQQAPSGALFSSASATALRTPVAGGVTVKIVDPLEMIEVEQEQDRLGLRVEHVDDRAHQLAPVGEAGAGIGIGIALREPLGRFIGVERLLEVLRAAPAEQDQARC